MYSNESKNQEYKRSGSRLPFKDWLQQDLNNSVNQVLSNINALPYDIQDMHVSADGNLPYVNSLSNNTILGVNKFIVYGAVALVFAGISYSAYKHFYKK